MNVPTGKVWQPTADAKRHRRRARARRSVIGVVLAGGLGRRMGAPKATALLAGRPLISYPLDALAAVCEHVVVVAKRDSQLPAEAERWDEPDEPRHPLAGLVYALDHAAQPILVCAADLPFVTPEVARRLVDALQPDRMAAVADGQPLFGAYAAAALEPLRDADPDAPLRRIVEALDPVVLEVEPDVLFNVNTPDDLAEAERRLRPG